jgi:uncharacterized membrane protein YhaH (DUF805 family)
VQLFSAWRAVSGGSENMNYFLEAFRKYAVFSGRARRSEYWYFTLFSMIALAILRSIDHRTGMYDPETSSGTLEGIYGLIVFIPTLAIGVRRLHDTGRSGWWLLINLVPVAGWIINLIFDLQDSQPGSNQYGANPKGEF